MAQTSRPCMGCGQIIYRTAPTAPIKHYCGPDCRPRCSVDGCEKPRHGNTYCSAHHARWKRYGDPEAPLLRHPNAGLCSVNGCDQPMRKRTWCAGHYAQWQRYGEVRPFEYKWGDGGYVSTHNLIRRRRGKAVLFVCVDCGGPAEEWSYDHNDPDERTRLHGGHLVTFSRNPDCYSPRCVRCHRIYDENPIAMK